MSRVIVALLFFFIVSIDAQAQSGWKYLDDSPERLIGLLDLPDIVGDGCDLSAKRATARVSDTPSPNGRQVGIVHLRDEGNAGCWLKIELAGGQTEDMPTLESGYEIVAAIVYERRGSWFRIRLPRGSGWINRNNARDFLPYPEMLRDRLANTLQSWDGTLRETPGTSGKVTPLSPGWKALLDRQLNIEYLGSRRVGSDLWIHVQLIIDRCGQSLEGLAPVTGWIPAYHSSRSPSAWFASRGC